jgi:uncharacterized Zn-binding protein involved in type VI secretion
MPAVARANGSDSVFSIDGVGKGCRFPTDTTTGTNTQTNVLVEGIYVVIQGDVVGIHNKSGCTPDESELTTCSSKVFVNGKGIARIGDSYTTQSINYIKSGSAKVFAG